MKTVEFLEHTTEVPDEHLNQSIVDINFNNDLIVKFELQPDNESYIAINAMNGYGRNIKDEVFGKFLIIKEDNNG